MKNENWKRIANIILITGIVIASLRLIPPSELDVLPFLFGIYDDEVLAVLKL